ncbi:MAG: GNAT family N-acetyltransferase [Chlamydiales bacterium]|nr:GNAT family N-acetyltransferase [Chlamydiales bacterium]
MLSILLISEALVDDFLDMTFPKYKKYILTDPKYRQQIVAVGALMGLTPIGLALAKIEGAKAIILSIFVHEPYRGQKIALHLLSTLENELLRRGCSQAVLEYSTQEKEEISPIERLLQRQNWSINTLNNETLVHWDFSSEQLSFCLRPKCQTKASTCISLYSEISDYEKKYLLNHSEALQPGWNPFSLSDYPIEKLNSLVARNSLGKIKGWLITHRFDAETIRYTALFVQDDARRYGFAMYLIYEALRRQFLERLNIPRGICLITNHSLLLFSKNKNLQPNFFLCSKTASKFLLADI